MGFNSGFKGLSNNTTDVFVDFWRNLLRFLRLYSKDDPSFVLFCVPDFLWCEK